MADKRMFSKAIIDSDMFLDMSLSTQALYFHLNMRADDDGFVNNPKKIQRMIGSAPDDMNILLAKGFIIQFGSGVCVIKHWRIHNYLRKDRYKETIYKEEKSQLYIEENKAYNLDNVGQPLVYQTVDQLETQTREEKNRLDKNREDKTRIEENMSSLSDEFCSYVVKLGFTLDSELGQALSNDIKEFGLNEVKNALSISASKGKNYSYAKAILNNRQAEGKIKKGIKTFEDTRDSFLKNAHELIEDDYNF